MIIIDRTPPAKMREAHKQEAILAGAPEILNLQNAIDLEDGRLLLPWDGVEYTVKRISYPEGLRLQKTAYAMESMKANPPRSADEVEDAETFIEGVTDLFHSLLDPKPSANPFFDATPLEVGALLGFFFACRMKQLDRPSSRLGVSTRVTH